MSGAFGDAGRKQALLEDFAQEGPVYQLWATQAAFGGDLSSIARDFSLHPALVGMMPVLGEYGRGEAKAFFRAAIEALPVGADTITAVRRWFLLVWDAPTWGISPKLQGTPSFEPAQAVIDLVRASIDPPIDKATWRAARSRLAVKPKRLGPDGALAGIVLSMAWDLDQTPGAAQDVVGGYNADVYFTAYTGDDDALTAAEETWLFEHSSKAHRAALDQLGELSRDSAGMAAYQRVTDAYWAAVPEAAALLARQEALVARARAKADSWRRSAQNALVDLLARAPRSAAP